MPTFGGGSDNQTQTQTSEPWAAQKPYLEYGFEQALNQYQGSNPNYFPESTVVGFAPETQAAMQGITARAFNGSPLNAAASNQLQNVINGDYLTAQNLNPYFDQARRSIDSQFAGSGRYGSGLHKNALAETFGNIAANQYGQERAHQMQAMGMAPALASQDYTDMQQLANVGASREQMAGQILGDRIDRFNFEQNKDQAKLADYMALIQGNYGGTSVSEADGGSNGNGLGQAVGTVASLASLAQMFSDRRLKKDIKEIGEVNGFPVYEFSYIWDDVKRIGFMAQDVIKKLPEAVETMANGFMAVNYKMVLEAQQ